MFVGFLTWVLGGMFDKGQFCLTKPTRVNLACLISVSELWESGYRGHFSSLSWLWPHASPPHFSRAESWLALARMLSPPHPLAHGSWQQWWSRRAPLPCAAAVAGGVSVFWTGNLLRGVPEVDECDSPRSVTRRKRHVAHNLDRFGPRGA
jgi:hypothetical protein